ncbi:uncharacterized protein YcfJ [Crenobacter luteus]|uniref:glycine zipper 2TM domain-containing protein n=1 Tax=Crenobacter luteus TaxID=1452487 RepID=UPI0010471FD7|nr:glycine zipper 2TM domain-containing protein [Crenobacter luteus]TCP11348.1 uncharacterized protein YcfJ [Crenobacter luteus]
MKNSLVLSLLALASGAVHALSYTDYATVIRSEPVYEQIQTPCAATGAQAAGGLGGLVTAENGGAVIGGLLGGLAGNQVGGGSGKKVATVVGAIGGAMVGRQIGQQMGGAAPAAPSCQPTLQRQLVGYAVTYDWRGQRETVTLPADPGKRLELRVSAEPVAR